jgi:hypothetical protein
MKKRGWIWSIYFGVMLSVHIAAAHNKLVKADSAVPAESPSRIESTPEPVCALNFELEYIGKDLRVDVAEYLGADTKDGPPDAATQLLKDWNDPNKISYRITYFLNPKAVGLGKLHPQVKNKQFAIIQMYKGNTPIEGAWDATVISTGRVHVENDGTKSGRETKVGWSRIQLMDPTHISLSYPKPKGGAPMYWYMGIEDEYGSHSGVTNGEKESHECIRLPAPNAANKVPGPIGNMLPDDKGRIIKQSNAHMSEYGKSYMFYKIVESMGMRNGLVHSVDDNGGLQPEDLPAIEERLYNPKQNSQVALDFNIFDFKTNGKTYINPGTENIVNKKLFKDGYYDPDSGNDPAAIEQAIQQKETERIVIQETDDRRTKKPGFFQKIFGKKN